VSELEPDVVSRLQDIGLHAPDPTNPLHVRLVDALRRTRGASVGNQLVAMKFEFNWELNDAGAVFAKAKADYEHHIDVETVRLRATLMPGGKALSRLEAEQIARSGDSAYGMQLAFLLAEQRERSMRKFLDTLSSALELHRTDRADQRAADVEHGRSGV
jgi:hypothetical protein